ncbi:MAG: acyltransferase, partial [Ilumatobacteraceae bacterium]|nr:acyltransferase [Ilumatobacteraceae bacterium]
MKFRSDIEGLRAIAVVLVVLYHMDFSLISGGYIGVDIFLVISGFLISRLLVDEFEKTGAISLRQFYARRIRRLLPISSFVLLV